MRQFLRTNKIYFETIAAISLTIASLLVGFASLEISWNQYSDNKQKESPSFRMEVRHFNQADLYTPELQASLYNDAGPVKILGTEIVEWISITTPWEGKKTVLKEQPYCCNWREVLPRRIDSIETICKFYSQSKKELYKYINDIEVKIADTGSIPSYRFEAILEVKFKNIYGNINKWYFDLGNNKYDKVYQKELENAFREQKSRGEKSLWIHEDVDSVDIHSWISALHHFEEMSASKWNH
jgi:hypothetical protein